MPSSSICTVALNRRFEAHVPFTEIIVATGLSSVILSIYRILENPTLWKLKINIFRFSFCWASYSLKLLTPMWRLQLPTGKWHQAWRQPEWHPSEAKAPLPKLNLHHFDEVYQKQFMRLDVNPSNEMKLKACRWNTGCRGCCLSDSLCEMTKLEFQIQRKMCAAYSMA